MANNFKIVITASDKATATIRKVKDGIAQFTRPIRQVKASIGALGREIGLDRVTQGLGRMARGAEKVAQKALTIVSAITAVAGVGSIAAIAAMTREWAFAGAEVLRFAGIVGQSTNKVQTLRGAALAFGLSAEDMSSGLKSLGDTIEDAAFGRNPQAMALMSRLSIQMKRTKDGSVDAAAALYDVANAIQRTKNVQAQGLIARTFGVEALLPLLQKGAAGIREYEKAVAKSGAVQSPAQLERARQLALQLAMMKLSVTGLANSIMSDLAPSLITMVQGFSKWAQENRGVISANLKGFIGGVVDGVKFLAGVLGGAGGIIAQTIGWRGAGTALAWVLGGRLLMAIYGLIGPITLLTARMAFVGVTAIPRLLLGVAALTESAGLPLLARAFFATGIAAEAMLGPIGLALAAITALIAAMRWLDAHEDHRVAPSFGGRGRGTPGGKGDPRPHPKVAPRDPKAAAQAMAYFQQQGYSKNEAAGIVGNLAYESGLNPGQSGDNGAAYGIAQWHKARQDAFKKFAGKDIRGSSLADQLRFVHHELSAGGERAAGARLKGANDAAQASDAVEYGYERPSDRAAASSRYDRQTLAQQLADGKGLAAQLAKAQPGGAPAAGAQHKLVVEFKNAPPGMKAEVKTAGAAAKPAVKIGYAMEELSPP